MKNTRIVRAIKFIALAVLIANLVNLGTAAPGAVASSFITVDRTDDPTPIPSTCVNSTQNDCSLRGAIIYANAHPHSEIVLGHGLTYVLSIPRAGSNDVTTGDLNFTADTTIDFGNVLCFSNCAATIQGISGWLDTIIRIAPGIQVEMLDDVIKNGNSNSKGGGIFNSGELTLRSCHITGNTAEDMGGGIYNNSGANLMLASTIVEKNHTNNPGYGGGGGLYQSNSSTVTALNSTFSENNSTSDGGAINSGGTITLTNTSVISNIANGSGGGIESYGTLIVNGGSISSNVATNYTGGGLKFDGSGDLVITGTDISNNTSKMTGAGIAFLTPAATTTTLTNIIVNNNHMTGANSEAGGISFDGSSATLNITGGTVHGNVTTSGTGGGIYVIAASYHMSGTTISGNTGYMAGGGLWLKVKTATINTSNIFQNTLTGEGAYGGGLYLNSGVLTMTSSSVNGNSLGTDSSTGGGVYIGLNSSLTMAASTISGNTASQGGGIFAVGAITLTNSTISSKTALSTGGGGMQINTQAALITNVTITANHAPNGAGGGLVLNNSPHVKNSLIAGNSASSGQDCAGTLVSQGYNLLGNSSNCNGLTNGVNGDLVGTSGSPLNPKIGPLLNNGGPTLTHALLTLSPAINAADPDPVKCPAKDQRGFSRPFYSRCDIGSFEFVGVQPYLYLPIVAK